MSEFVYPVEDEDHCKLRWLDYIQKYDVRGFLKRVPPWIHSRPWRKPYVPRDWDAYEEEMKEHNKTCYWKHQARTDYPQGLRDAYDDFDKLTYEQESLESAITTLKYRGYDEYVDDLVKEERELGNPNIDKLLKDIDKKIAENA